MRLANCWLVAMWIWLAGHCRQYAWIRRSHSFGGLIPHFGIAERLGWRYLRVIEYVPPKADLGTRRNLLLLFSGHYRVWHLRVLAVRRWPSRDLAQGDFFRGG